MKKASLTAVLTWVRAQVSSRGRGFRVVRRGYASNVKIIIRLDGIVREVGCLTATWIRTKSVRLLRPMDELLSFSSGVE